MLTQSVSFWSHSRFSPSPLKTLSFSRSPQTCLRKMTISDSFIVGSSWNLNTKFKTQFRAFSPLGILTSCLSWENARNWVANVVLKFHDDPTINESKIVIFLRQIWWAAGKRMNFERRREKMKLKGREVSLKTDLAFCYL